MSQKTQRHDMLQTNVRQQDYYESRFEANRDQGEERAANRATRAWTKLRRRIQRLRDEAGGDDQLIEFHRTWLGDLRDKSVLDLGCFDGNRLSLWIAESSAHYVGIDLSEQATAELNRKLEARGLDHATALAMDFLANEWPDGHFDVVYAYSVLHHFAELDVALQELRRVVKPGGIVVTMDPMATEPFNRLGRALFRPVQTDRAWEFPFSRGTFDVFRRYFVIERLQGIQGAIRLAYPFLMFSGTRSAGRRLAKRLLAYDATHARAFNMQFFLSWQVAMKLRRPELAGGSAARGRRASSSPAAGA